jgi:hypothetical protein
LLRLYERRRLTAKNPNVRVWRLLAEERREEARDSADFYFQYVMNGFAGGTSRRERFLSGSGDSELYEARLRRGGHKRHCLWRSMRLQILQYREDQTVGKVRWDFEVFGLNLLFPVIVGVTDGDPTARTID